MAKKNKPGKDAKKDDKKDVKKDVKAKVKKGAAKKPVAKKAAAPKAVPAKKAAPAKKATPAKKAAPAKKATPAKKAAPAKKTGPAKRATRSAVSSPVEPYWLNARILPVVAAAGAASAPALSVTTTDAFTATSTLSMVDFAKEMPKFRVTLTLDDDDSVRLAQLQAYERLLREFLGRYPTIHAYCATCQSNKQTQSTCPDES
jgi:hypothetical protein